MPAASCADQRRRCTRSSGSAGTCTGWTRRSGGPRPAGAGRRRGRRPMLAASLAFEAMLDGTRPRDAPIGWPASRSRATGSWRWTSACSGWSPPSSACSPTTTSATSGSGPGARPRPRLAVRAPCRRTSGRGSGTGGAASSTRRSPACGSPTTRTGCGAAPGSATPYARAFEIGCHLDRGDVAAARRRRRRRARRSRPSGKAARLLQHASPGCWSPRAGTRRRWPRVVAIPDARAGRQPGLEPVAQHGRARAARPRPHGRGDRLLEEEVRLLRRWGAPSYLGAALRLLGRLRGRRARALREAVDLLSGRPPPSSWRAPGCALGAAPRGAGRRGGPAAARAASEAAARLRRAEVLRAGRAPPWRPAGCADVRTARPPPAARARSGRCSSWPPPGWASAEVAQRLFLTPGTVHAVLERRPTATRLKFVSSSPTDAGGHDRRERSPVTQQQVPTSRPPGGGPARPVRRLGAPARRPRPTTWPARRGTCRCPTTRPRSPTRRSPTRSPTCCARPPRPGSRSPPQGTGHGAPPLQGRLARGRPAAHLGDDRAARRPGPADRPRRRRRPVGRSRRDAAGRHGLAALHPSSPDVGVVGYTLGGGIGWYARRLGPAVQRRHRRRAGARRRHVRARHRRRASRAVLGAARRGGAARRRHRAGVRPFPLDTVVAGYLAWDWTAVERVLPAWVAWCADAPEEATTSFRLLDVPTVGARSRRALRGRRLAMIDGAVLGDDDAAARVLAPLRALRPEFDTVARVPAASWSGCTWSPRGRRRPTPAARWSPACPTPPIAAVVEAVGPGSEHRAWPSPSCASSAGRWPGPTRPAARWPRSTARSWRSGSGFGASPSDWASSARTPRRFLTAARAVGDRAPVPADARRPHRHPEGLPARGARPAVRDPARVDPRGLFVAPHTTCLRTGLKSRAQPAVKGPGPPFLRRHPDVTRTWRTP